jgi:hypothetical protein
VGYGTRAWLFFKDLLDGLKTLDASKSLNAASARHLVKCSLITHDEDLFNSVINILKTRDHDHAAVTMMILSPPVQVAPFREDAVDWQQI